MVLSTTISQRCWTDLQLFATSHGKTVSEVVEDLLALGAGLSPYREFFADWYARRSPEETLEHLRRQREGAPAPTSPDPVQ
jgi:hypothetical protein